MLERIFKNWKTSLVGAVIGVVLYLAGPGVALPDMSNPREAVHAVASILVAGVSLALKDGWINPGDPKMIAWFLLPALTLSGCASIGQHPIAIDCKGKGRVMDTASAAGYSGQAVLEADCGEGFSFRSGVPAKP